jgi:hypothetical protein
MMKKLISLVLTVMIASGLAFGQHEAGTAPEGYVNPDPGSSRVSGLTVYYSVTGNYSLSADGTGFRDGPIYTIGVEKPNASAVVEKAILMHAPVPSIIHTPFEDCVTLQGIPITWDITYSNVTALSWDNNLADVTSIVKPVVDGAAPGIIPLSVEECGVSVYQDGTALLVIFDDPLAEEQTILVLFGGLSTTGDNFNITLGAPIDPADGVLDMGLGISFGAQGTAQYSAIDVTTNVVTNGPLTSSAGGQDDAVGTVFDGSLITVGGIGDVNTNPPDPTALPNGDPRYDDELYSLIPFIDNTTTTIEVNTLNPSNDDNVFMAYFIISGTAIVDEDILITQTINQRPVNTVHEVVALVQNEDGDPIINTPVDFEVISGPNTGVTFTGNTDGNGNVTFTYTGSGGPGFDQIQACFLTTQAQYKCSNILTIQWFTTTVPLSDWALYIGIFLMVAFAVIRIRKIF